MEARVDRYESEPHVHTLSPRTRPRRHAITLLVVSLVVAGVLAGVEPVAYAAGGPGGSCNPHDPSCTVGVGGGGSGGSGSGSGGGGGGVVSPGCHNTDPESGCDPCPSGVSLADTPDPAACQEWEQNLFCSELNPSGVDYVAWVALLKSVGCWQNPYTPGSPAVAAENALASIHFPSPTGSRSPNTSLRYEGYPFTYVNLWTFFWTSPTTWRTLTATATDKDQSATVTARPVELEFDPGDGAGPVACDGPGRAWTAADGNGPPSAGACAYQYSTVTATPVTSVQTIVWQITWTGTGNTSGEIPSLSTSTSGQLQVLQVQVVSR